MTARRFLPLAALALALSACQGTPATTAPETSAPATTTSSTPTASARPSSPASPSSPGTSSSARPSTSATTATTPLSDAERYAAVVPAYHAYWAAVDDMRNAGGYDDASDDMRRTMGPAPLDYWTSVAKDWKQYGIYSEGRYEVVHADPTQVAVGPDNGRASLEYCVDTSKAVFKSKDPKETPPDKSGRYRKGTATMEWLDGRWKLTDAKESKTETC